MNAEFAFSTDIYVYDGDKIDLSSYKPQRNGYEFKGWYYDKNCTNAFKEDTVATTYLTLYAKWVQLSEYVIKSNTAEISQYNLQYTVTPVSPKKAKAKSTQEYYYDIDIPAYIDGYEVTSIGDTSFDKCSDYNISSVRIPNTVTTISKAAFNNLPDSIAIIADKNSAAETFAIENGYISSNQNDGVFTYRVNNGEAEITGLVEGYEPEEIIIPSKIQSYSVTSIGEAAFKDCSSLKSITISSGIKNINSYAFQNCTLLENIIFPDTIVNIGAYALLNCEKLKTCIIPDSVISIGKSILNGCSELESIAIPFIGYKRDDVSTIGYFFGTSNYNGASPIEQKVWYSYSITYYLPITLTSVSINGSNSIPASAFYNCCNIENITLSNYTTSIERSAFYNCSNLNNIYIPDNVTNVGYGAFEGCISLLTITGGNNIISIDKSSLENTGFFYDETNWEDGLLYLGNSLICCNEDEKVADIKDGTKCIASNAFNNCKSIESIKIPNSVSTIGNYAFNCQVLKELVIPNSVEYIGHALFYQCDNLEIVNIGDGVQTFPYRVFDSCRKLKTVYIGSGLKTGLTQDIFSNSFFNLENIEVSKNNNYYASDEGVLFNKSKTTLIMFPAHNKNTEYVIPSSVTHIGDNAFNFFGYCGHLDKLTIPNGVVSIGYQAFYNCRMQGIKLPSSLKSIGAEAFRGCDNYYFNTIDIPENVDTIGEDAFSGCDFLTEINVSEANTKYSSDCGVLFNEDKSILLQYPAANKNKIYFVPETVKEISDEAFYGYKYLESIVIPSSLETIGWTNFGNNADYRGHKIQNVLYTSSDTDWNNIVIKSNNNNLLTANYHCDFKLINSENIISTCQVEGHFKYTCSCGYVISGIYPLADCDYHANIVEPTCTTQGYTEYECSVCGNYYHTNTVDPLGHNFIDGVCQNCSMEESDCIESEHPYANNYDNTWTINKPDAKRIAITFSENTETESCDYIYIYDKDDNEIGCYSGTDLASKRIVVKGDTVKIRLVTDGSITYYGFTLSNVQAYYEDCSHSETEMRNSSEATCANDGYTGDICCIECDEVISKGEIIPKTDNHDMYESVVEPTCTEQGYKEYYCWYCDYSYKTDFTNATGVHTYVNGFCRDCKAKDPNYEIPIINANETQNVEIRNGGDYYYVTFTPNSNGTCTFYSEGNYDTYAYLYDENMNELVSNDDGGEDYNFSITYDLQIGKKYIFACRMLNSGEIGSFDVTLKFKTEEHVHSYVSKTVKPTCTRKGYTTYTCECGDSYVDNYVNATGHSYDSGKVTKKSTCTATGIKTYTCTKCKAAKTETIAQTAHTYKTTTTKATISKNGSIVTKCTVCGNVSKNTTIYYPKTITLSKTSYTYNGKAQKPTVTVKDSKGNKIAASNYTVTYQSGRKNVGKHSVKITFKGNYSGSKTLYFTIIPKATTLSSVTAKSKGFTVKWKKQATQTTGYEIQYATDSKFTKNKKTVTVSKNSTTSKTISKLKAKKKYYVRIRTYKTVKVNGKNTKLYSSWSKSKTITTKK